MKKLKIALILVFALTCSLFLFACGGKEETAVQLSSITISGAKTAFTEADTAFSTGDDFTVTGKFSDGTSRELTSDEYTVDSEAVNAAFELIKDGDYDNARGTYKVTVQGSVNDFKKSTSYNVTIDHAWVADGDGFKCTIDGAQKASYTVDEHIVIGPAWAADPVVSGTNTKAYKSTSGGNWLTYGSISLGQSISISGTGYTTGSDTWDTPVLGIFKNPNTFMARGDTWVIGADSKWNGYNWSIHSGGSAATAYEFDSYEDFVESATEWEVYYDGSASASYWGSESAPVDFSIKWDYNKLGFIAIEVTVDGTTYYRYIKVSNSSYEVVFYAEDCVFDVTSVDVVQNLVLDENGFTQLAAPTKQYYAENNMIEIDSETSGIVGAKYQGSYNDGKYKIEIGTYDIYADMQTGVDEDGNAIIETIDLRTNQLQAEMTNFRVAFGGYELPITVNVVPSSIKSVATSYDFGAGINSSNLYFENSSITLEYDVTSNASGAAIAVKGTGTVTALTAEQKAALNTSKDYYVALRLVGDASEAIADVECSITDAVKWVDANGVNVLIPVASASEIKNFTVTVKSNVTAETVVNVDFSGVSVPAVSGVIVSNTTSIDAEGVVTVEYKGVTDPSKYDFYVGSSTRSWDKVQEGATIGNVTFTGSYNSTTKVLTVEYTLPALDIAAGSNIVLSYAVRITDGTNSASVTLPYNLVVSESNSTFYKVNDTTYITVSSNYLSVLVIEDSRQLAGNGEITLNIQNDTGAAYDLSFTASNSGITMNSVNAYTKSAKTVLALTGTIGDNSDGDLAALYVVRIAWDAANVSLSDGFWFEVVNDSRADNDTEYTLVYVKDSTFTEKIIDSTEAKVYKGTKTCITNAMLYYYTADTFKFGQSVSEYADGAHNYVENEDGTQTCSICGTTIYGETTKLAMVVGPVAGATENGFTVSFTLSGNAADWGSNIITPVDKDGNNTGCNISIPNLDPWGSTIGVNAVNAYPGVTGSTLYNGAAYNVFQGEDECQVTITVSPSAGITFYKDGVKVLNYAYTGLFGDGTTPIATYIDALLANVEAYGFIFGAGSDGAGTSVGTVSDLVVYPAALTDAQIQNLNAWTYVTTTELNLSIENIVVWTFYGDTQISKGTAVTFYGSQKGSVANNWNTMLFEFSDNVGWTSRWDVFGWSFTPEVTNGLVDAASAVYTGSIVDSNGDIHVVNQEDAVWNALFVETLQDCEWTLRVNFSTDGIVTSTLTVNGANGCTYTQVLTFSFSTDTPDYITIHFTGEAVDLLKIDYYVTSVAL